MDKFISDSLIQLDGQSLQAKDKQVWGEGVTLTDAPAGHHFWERGSIPKNMETSRGDHIHDEGNEISRHLKEFKGFLDKGPLETIICFFEIQLKSHVSSLRVTYRQWKALMPRCGGHDAIQCFHIAEPGLVRAGHDKW